MLFFILTNTTRAENAINASEIENLTSTYSYITEFSKSNNFKNRSLVQKKISEGISFLESNNMKVVGVKHIVFFNTPNERDKIYIRIVFTIEITDDDEF